MYIYRVAFEYECLNPNCTMINLFPIRDSIHDPSMIAVMAERHSPERCYICNCAMRVKRATIFRIAKSFEPFGDPKKGHWDCPKRCNALEHVYPLPLQAAAEGIRGDKSKMWPSIYLHKYEKVAAAGYPWKCPICSQELEYTEDLNG